MSEIDQPSSQVAPTNSETWEEAAYAAVFAVIAKLPPRSAKEKPE